MSAEKGYADHSYRGAPSFSILNHTLYLKLEYVPVHDHAEIART